jgi:centrin-3
MRALGFDVKKAEVLKLLKEYDKNGHGLIEFDDFNRISIISAPWLTAVVLIH